MVVSNPHTGLGWGQLPLTKKQYPISPALPSLSLAEESLAREVLETFYMQRSPQQTHEGLRTLLAEYCQLHHLRLEDEQAEELNQILRLHAFEAGPLTPLLHDNGIEEIALTGVSPQHPVRVYVAQKGWSETNLYFTDPSAVITLFNRLTLETGKRLSAHTPVLNAILPNGSQIHAAIAPVCSTEIEASIRQFTQRTTQPGDLIQLHTLTSESLAYLTLALQLDCNLLIVGNTGSGKTTTLNALIGTFAENERIILIEETPELRITHPHQVRLIPNADAKMDMARLIRETLRMRPDRVIVGEIRFPEEAHAFMESILAGQGKGTLATFHGHSGAEAVARLHAFGILHQDIAWISIILVQRRWTEYDSNGRPRDVRGVCEIAELFFDPINGLTIQTLFAQNTETGKLEMKNESVLVRERFSRSFPGKEWKTEYAARVQSFTPEIIRPHSNETNQPPHEMVGKRRTKPEK